MIASLPGRIFNNAFNQLNHPHYDFFCARPAGWLGYATGVALLVWGAVILVLAFWTFTGGCELSSFIL